MRICPVCHNDQNSDTATFCNRCGAALLGIVPGTGTGQLLSQTILHGRYVISHLVGKGGMGAVYQVTDLHIPGKLWAIKEMSDAALGSATEKAQAVAAFRQEAQLLASLKHPNLPHVVDYFTEGGRHYLVMDFIEGETLDMVLARSGSLAEGQLLVWAAQLCDVLGYLHGQSDPIIFRDLKPGNVMITPQGQLKLIDFGIARFFKPGQQSDTQPIGTQGYSPPEQYGKGQTDARSDLYSLGVMMHELLTGHDPTQTPFQLPPVRQLNPNVSPQMEQVILQATAMNPHHRFASAEEMKQALAALLVSGTSTSVGPLPPSSSPPAPHALPAGRRMARTVAATVVAVCLAGIIGAWAIWGPGPPTPNPMPPTWTATREAAMASGTPSEPTTTSTLTASYTPLRTPTHTAMPSPEPSRTATQAPLTPTPTDLEAALEDVIWRYVALKDRAMGHWETEDLNTALRRGALSTQLGSVNWLRENNSRWEYDLHSMTFDQFDYQSADHVRVLVTKVETGRFYHQGSPTPSEIRSYYDLQYEIWYNLEKIEGQWYITDIDL